MKPIFRVLFVGVFLLILAGCGSSTTSTPTPEPTPSPTIEPTATPFPTAIPAPVSRAEQLKQQSFIRFIQGSWNLPDVDVYVDGAILGYNMRFGQVTEPQPLIAGDYTLRLMPAGVDLNSDSEQTLYNYGFNLPEGETLTLIIGGDPSNLNIQRVGENLTPIEQDTSRVTLIHALNQGGGLGVRVDNDVLIAPIGAYQISHDAPIHNLFSQVQIVTPEGEVIAEYDREFRSRVAVTLVMIGDASIPESVRLVNYTTRVYGNADVMFINSITDQPSIDIYLDGSLIAGGVIYGVLHDFISLKPADYQLEILPSGAIYQSSDVLYRTLINLYEDEISTVAFSYQNSRITHLIASDNLSIAPASQARIRFIHSIYDGGEVIADLADVSQTLYGGDVSRERWVDADAYSITWSDQSFESYTTSLDIQSGNHYTVIYVARDVEPLVMIYAIGEENQPVVDETETTSDEPSPLTSGASVYVVNLVSDENVIDLVIGDAVLANVPRGNLISGGYVTAENASIVARVAGTDTIFAMTEYPFRDDYFYTIYVTGENRASSQLHIFEHGFTDDLLDPQQGIVQFLNLSLYGSDWFSVGLSDGAIQLAPLTVEGEIVPNRYLVNGDYIPVTSALRIGQVTYPQYLTAGTYQAVIMDTNTGNGLALLPNLSIQTGMRYDVIIVQDINTEVIQFTVLGYPAP